MSRNRNVDPPDNFLCPISQEIMTNPVIGSDGHTYERASIEEWLGNSNTSPMTRAPMLGSSLVPNISLRVSIEEWQRRRSGGAATDGSAETPTRSRPPRRPTATPSWIQHALTSIQDKISATEQLVTRVVERMQRFIINNDFFQRINSLLPPFDQATANWIEFTCISIFTFMAIGKFEIIPGIIFAVYFLCLKHSTPSPAALQLLLHESTSRKQVKFILVGLLLITMVLVSPFWFRFAVLASAIGVPLLQHIGIEVSDNQAFLCFVVSWVFAEESLKALSDYILYNFILMITLYMMIDSKNFVMNKFCGSIGFILCRGYQTNYHLFLLSWFIESLVLIVPKYQTKLKLSWCRQEALLYAVCVQVAVAYLWPGMSTGERLNQMVTVLLLLTERMGPQSPRELLWLATLVLAFCFPSSREDACDEYDRIRNPIYQQRECTEYSMFSLACMSLYDVLLLLVVKYMMVEKFPFTKTTRTYSEFSNHMNSLFGHNLLHQGDVCYALFIEKEPKIRVEFDLVTVVSEGVVRDDRGGGGRCVVRKVTAPSDSVGVDVPVSRLRCAEPFTFIVRNE
mmetsp:Transcript_24852/g.42070  ORF Transcript_24852/g.42070 Transcript_24852/m.42070 type:complete len:568 (-) Transcript_24852:159-1862(-)